MRVKKARKGWVLLTVAWLAWMTDAIPQECWQFDLWRWRLPTAPALLTSPIGDLLRLHWSSITETGVLHATDLEQKCRSISSCCIYNTTIKHFMQVFLSGMPFKSWKRLKRLEAWQHQSINSYSVTQRMDCHDSSLEGSLLQRGGLIT